MNQTKVFDCTCKDGQSAIYQDRVYGKGRRLFIRGNKSNNYVCTICGRPKVIFDGKKK